MVTPESKYRWWYGTGSRGGTRAGTTNRLAAIGRIRLIAASLTCNTRSAAKLGTVGIAMGNQQIKLTNSEGITAAIGKERELCIRGAQVMMSYWQRPDETDKAIDAKGFFRTDDIAAQAEDGS